MLFEEFSSSGIDGMYAYEAGNDFTIIKGNSLYVPHATTYNNGEQVLKIENLLEGKEIGRCECRDCKDYLLEIDGKTYTISQYSDGFKEVEAKAIYPCLADGTDIAYIVPTSADKTIGDLYIQNGVVDTDLRFVASDVVASSNGVIHEDAFDGFEFYFLKCTNGKYSLNKMWMDNNLTHKDYDALNEKVLFEGKLMPLYCTEASLYYYDLDNKDLYFVDYYQNEEGKVKKIYSGNIDEYYGFELSDFMFVDGDNVYYFNKYNTEEAQLVMTTGIDRIVYRGEVSDYGFNGGHMVDADADYCVFYDKNGDEYAIGQDKEKGAYSCHKLSHRIEEDKVTYYAGLSLMYIQDGVVCIDVWNGVGYDAYIKFNKETAVDYCSDYTGEFFFVYTKEGNLYYYNGEKKEYEILDSGLDPDKDGTGCNFAFDVHNEKLVYGKGGIMYSYDPEYEKISEKDMTYFYFTYEDSIVYCYYKDSDEKYYYVNGRAYKIF